jgi:DUF917 family protein
LRRVLGAADLEAAILGGLVLSAGGSGRGSASRHRRLGEAALAYGAVAFATLDEFDDDDALLVSTAVGAPGQGKANTEPRDAVEAAHAVLAASGVDPGGVIPGHVPGLYAWVIASALGVPVADAATNGRAHPTVKMGAMGLASRPEVKIWQAGSASGDAPLSVLVHGDVMKTSGVMRAAAIQNGGLINAVRGPFSVEFVREHGAPGAIAFAHGLGDAMLAKEGAARIQAAAGFLKGQTFSGEVATNDIVYRDGFDVGKVSIRTPKGLLVLGVYNEFMTATLEGARIATFPDMLASFDARTGEPVSMSEMKAGTAAAIVIAPRSSIPLGAGVFDPAVYPEVEKAMGEEIASYALNRTTKK